MVWTEPPGQGQAGGTPGTPIIPVQALSNLADRKTGHVAWAVIVPVAAMLYTFACNT
mgnify:CR=1 FL=1